MAVSRETVEAYGVAVMFAFTLALAVVWFAAFASGGRVLVAIDTYGEMWPELLLWLLAAPLAGYATYSVVARTGGSA